MKMIIVGAGANAVPRVAEEPAAESQPAADSQPPASEASSSPMDVDSPTPGFHTVAVATALISSSASYQLTK